MKRPIPIYRGGSIEAFKTFQMNSLSGVDNLDPNLTINGTTVTPKFRYKLGDADATDLTPWGYGETLSRVSVATPPTYNDGSPGLGVNDDSCKFNASDYYKKTSATASQFTTGDIVIEVVWKNVDATQYIMTTQTTTGIYLYSSTSGTGNIKLKITDADGNVNVDSATDSAPGGTWNHGLVFLNRDEASTNGSQWYINGVSSGTGVDVSAVEKTLADTDFSIGDGVLPAIPYSSNIAYLAAWEQASWHQAGSAGPQEWAAIAAERFAKLTGIYPSKFKRTNVITDGDMEATGTAAWTAADSTLSKDTTAPLNQGTQHLRITSTANTFYASQNILKVGATYRITGAARSVSGSAVPSVSTGVAGLWTGTTSTDWQEFDIKAESGHIGLFLGSPSNHPGVVDFDNVVVELQSDIPVVKTRAYPAYLDKVESGVSKLYYVGGEWLRQCHRVDASAVDVKGYLPETQVENLIANSEVFTSYWGKIDAGDVPLDDQVACPDGRVVGGSIAADNTSGNHGLQKAIAVTAATYTYSWFAKPGNKDWVRLVNTTVANCDCFFDVANGTVGTAGAGATGYIEGPYTGGWYRICIVFAGTAASHTFQLRVADADNDDTISDGDGSTVNTYVWGAQVEQSDYMTSPIITAGATKTRLKDQLQFAAGANIGGEDVGQGTVACDVLLSDYDCNTGKRILAITDGGSASDRIQMIISTSDVLTNFTRASGGNDGDCTAPGDVVDGVKHEARLAYETDNIIFYNDGLPGTADASCDIPDDLDELDIGMQFDGTLQLNGLIQNLRIYKKPIKNG